MADDADVDTTQDDAETTDDAQGADDENKDQPDKPLGPAGEKALAAEKAKRREAEAKRRAAEARIKELEAGSSEAEKAKLEVERAAMAKANDRLVRAELKVAAAGKLADPTDAAAFIDLSQFTVDDDGNVDTDEVVAAIDDLIEKKPHLAASTARFQGGADQGARKKVPVKTLPEQIREAEAARDFRTARQLKAQLMLQPKTK